MTSLFLETLPQIRIGLAIEGPAERAGVMRLQSHHYGLMLAGAMVTSPGSTRSTGRAPPCGPPAP